MIKQGYSVEFLRSYALFRIYHGFSEEALFGEDYFDEIMALLEDYNESFIEYFMAMLDWVEGLDCLHTNRDHAFNVIQNELQGMPW